MKLIKSAVIVAVFALGPCLALAQEQKAPGSQPACPYLKAKQVAGDQAKSCCPAKADAADKGACSKKDGDKAACSQPAKEGCKKDGQTADAGSCYKAKDKQPAASAAN